MSRPESARQALHILTAAEMAAYDRDGFHIHRRLLDAREVAEVRDAFMELAAGGPVPGLSNLPPAIAPDDPLARHPRMMHPHAHPEHPRTCALARRWLLDGRIEAVLHDLMGEQPVAAQSMFYFKPPGARGQDFHQDNHYLRVAPGTCYAAWIAIDPADDANGGLILARGTHRLPTLTPSPADLTQSIATEHLDLPAGHDRVAADLAPGDVLFFNGQVIHGSLPNRSSDRFRRSLICHYLPASSQRIAAGYHRALMGFDGSRPSFGSEDDHGAPAH